MYDLTFMLFGIINTMFCHILLVQIRIYNIYKL